MSNYLIDTHCHLHDPEFYTPEQAEECLEEAHQNGVEQIIVIGTNHEDSLKAQSFAATHANVFWTYGIHPEEAGNCQINEIAQGNWANASSPVQGTKRASKLEFDDGNKHTGRTSTFLEVMELDSSGGRGSESLDEESVPLTEKKSEVLPVGLIAIGEIGLDYHYDSFSRPAQIHLFEQMLQLARDLDLPVSLHIRDAFADAWSVIDNFPGTRGVVHSFTGNKKELKHALDRDFYIGVNGLATYSTLPLPPLEKIVLETDAPFLTPIPFRGTMNKPGYVRFVADYLSRKMGVAKEVIAEQTTKNARQLFNLKHPILRPDEV